jgi:signal transduction histidine kinase
MKRNRQIALLEGSEYHARLFTHALSEHEPDMKVTRYTARHALLSAAARHRHDLAVLDSLDAAGDLPGLITELRAEHFELPIIVIADTASPDPIMTAIDAGATDYMVKGDDFAVLAPHIVRQAFLRHRVHTPLRRLKAGLRPAENLEIATVMAATLNHEINNPLMAILGCLELLRDDAGRFDKATRAKLKIIEQAAQRIRDITQQLATIATPTIHETAAGPMLGNTPAAVSAPRAVAR